MKRYKMVSGSDFWKTEDPEGEWVKWEDANAEMAWTREIYQNQILELKVRKQPECTCGVEADAMGIMPDGSGAFRKSSWVCPAHGYKKR